MKKYFILLIIIMLASLPSICKEQVHTQKVSPISLVKPYKDISYRIISINKLKRQVQSLSDAEKDVIGKYVFGAVKGEDTFSLMNGYLRGNLGQYINKKDITKPLQMRMKYYSDNLCTTLTKTELPQNTILYRGLDNKELSVFFSDKNVLKMLKQEATEANSSALYSALNGKEFTDKGFFVAYYDKDYVPKTNVVFEMKAPKKLQGALLANWDKKYEKTLIMNKGTNWKVTGVSVYKDKNSSKNVYKISVKYVM